MSKRLYIVGGVLACLLLLTGVALAMSSDNYRLDWYTPLTGSGGSMSSAHYAVDFTVGQTAVGSLDGTHYGACLGYWCMGTRQYLFLPLVLREHPG